MSLPEKNLSPENDKNNNKLLPLVVILGPTAVGKTSLSIQLAERFNAEIVSADSRLFYRGMDIGTAKPSLEERSRVPHHLIDVANPDEIWSLGMFQKEAHKTIHGIITRRHLSFLVGGTGQFIRAITEGWSVPSVAPDPFLREVLDRWGKDIGAVKLHTKLAIIDPLAAHNIEPSNLRRTVRALEVILTSGRRFSDQRQQGCMVYNPLLLGLTGPRPELYQRIDERIAKMMDMGFIQEVQQLLDNGYSPELPTLSAIGYGEVIAYLREKISLDEAIRLMKQRTRNFVRRQANWFKENDPVVHWFQMSNTTVDEMGKVIQQWLEINSYASRFSRMT